MDDYGVEIVVSKKETVGHKDVKEDVKEEEKIPSADSKETQDRTPIKDEPPKKKK